MINIFFKQDHKAQNFVTSPNPTRETMRQLACQVVGGSSTLKEYRFVIGCKQLDLEDEAKFEAARYLLTDNCTIFVLSRMLGGGFIEVSLLWDILLSELDSLLERAPKHMRECVVCMGDPEPCVKVCCAYVCVEHLRQNFRANDAKYVCYGGALDSSPCSKRLDLGAVLDSVSFTAGIKQFEETQQLMKHINCQVCRCGRFMLNETLWARQRCSCERTFCFFCNRDWQPGMINMLYHCSDACDYKTRLSHELVPLAYNDKIKVPNRRCCPFCFVLGSYDEKCKYHTCKSCNKSFCFICLKPEAECKRVYNSRYDHQCTEIVKQRFEDFPHLAV